MINAIEGAARRAGFVHRRILGGALPPRPALNATRCFSPSPKRLARAGARVRARACTQSGSTNPSAPALCIAPLSGARPIDFGFDFSPSISAPRSELALAAGVKPGWMNFADRAALTVGIYAWATLA